MKKNNSFFRFVRKNAFYIVMLVCMSLIGGTGYIAQRIGRQNASSPTPEKIVTYTEPDPAPIPIGEGQPEQQLPVVKQQRQPVAEKTVATLAEVEDNPADDQFDEAADQSQETEQPSRLARPHPGDEITPHSPDLPIKSKTFDDWRTHVGVDIAGYIGEEVKAVAAGVVEDIYDSETMGKTIVIKHAGGLKTIYSNLAEEVKVKEGQQVDVATVLANIGDSATAECGEAAHLHFETHIDDQPIDPGKFWESQ